ncbi:hypothetical protein [Desulfosarcina ovata]|uniref:DUF2262 domain-containing protein n=1 Tax=Desulfosarcina ovata subsp. ovata TaxID=2752305 RepID=A0A5K8AKF5_9BACT|nr:hypothetical protein [Desulfosarcina ovata]BBO93171.1 hypothetical protein DSCOOX_63510 [Desulfosarcina ovata subsp. ovata]
MLSIFKKFFGKIPQSLTIEDSDFGIIQYVEPVKEYPYGYWQMDDKWKVDFQKEPLCSAGIPGDESGPFESARKFILEKKNSPSLIWGICDSALREFIDEFIKDVKYSEPKDIFYISCISMDSDKNDPQGWEVCFDTKDEYRWINFCLQIEGNNIVSNTIST